MKKKSLKLILTIVKKPHFFIKIQSKMQELNNEVEEKAKLLEEKEKDLNERQRQFEMQ